VYCTAEYSGQIGKKTGGPEDRRKLHNEELHNLLPSKYYSVDQIKEENVHATRLWEKCIQTFGGKISRKDLIWKTQELIGR
jgi:hypothetical protein